MLRLGGCGQCLWLKVAAVLGITVKEMTSNSTFRLRLWREICLSLWRSMVNGVSRKHKGCYTVDARVGDDSFRDLCNASKCPSLFSTGLEKKRSNTTASATARTSAGPLLQCSPTELEDLQWTAW